MFGFFIKKGIYNLVVSKYIDNSHIYKNEVRKIISCLTDETTKDEMIKLNFQAAQKYYCFVFDEVCNEVAKNIPKFKSLLTLNLGAYDFDPNNLAAAHIYDFVFWCLTNKHASTKDCIKINHIVNDLKHKCLFELDYESKKQ